MAARRRRLKRNTGDPVSRPTASPAAGGCVVDSMPEFDHDIVVPPGAEPVETPSIVVDVSVRGRDLVSLTAEFYGCELFNAEEGPVVRPLPDARRADARSGCRTSTSASGRSTRPRRRHRIRRTRTPRHIRTDPGVDPPNARPDAAARSASGTGVPARLLDRGRGHDLVQHRRDPRRDGPPGDDRPSAGDAEAGRPTHDVAGPDRGRCQEESRPPSRPTASPCPRPPRPPSGRTDPVTQFRNLRHTRTILSTRRGVATRAAVTDEAGPSSIVVNGVEQIGRVAVRTGPDSLLGPDVIMPASAAANVSAGGRPRRDGDRGAVPARDLPERPGGWAHATEPVGADGPEHRVELWHSRLGVARGRRAAPSTSADPQRIVRAVWARDRETLPSGRTPRRSRRPADPFRMSLDAATATCSCDRAPRPGRASACQPIAPDRSTPRPLAVRARRLARPPRRLDIVPYSEAAIPSILAWDHVAPWGRDQYVRVVYPGYLYPFGSPARTLVKVTERKMKDASPSIAGLYQRKFLVRASRSDLRRPRLPFIEVGIAPLMSPTLDDPDRPEQDSVLLACGRRQRPFA